MYFEVLVVDFETTRVEHAAVGDEVFSGALVLWDKLPRAETLWMLDRLASVVTAWTGREARPRKLSMTGSEDGQAGRYTLEIDGQTATGWDALDAGARAVVLAELGAILATVNGLLEIV